MSEDLLEHGALALGRLIRERRLSCRELMQATLDRVARDNPRHNAIVSLRDGASLLAEADAHDARLAAGEPPGWLHGIPIAVKDMANVAGLPNTMGSPLMRGFVPTQDGLMAARLKAAGCIVIGKTNVPEFGLGSHTFNEVFGVTRNAWDASRSAGGSSGGAAVALARRMLSVADGSDFMGSLRNPAAWANVFGLRPSQGRVPMWPAQDVWVSQLGTEGPMARSVADLRALLRTQAGHDPRVPLSIAQAHGDPAPLDPRPRLDPKGLRIGWLGDLDGHLAMEPGLLEACDAALARLRALGCEVEPISLGFAPERVWEAWLVWRAALVSARVGPLLARRDGRSLVKPEAQWEHDQATGEGEHAGSGPIGVARLMAASATRSAFHAQMLKLLSRHDVLALPVTQVWPFDAAERWPRRIGSGAGAREMDTYHRWMEVVIYATFAGLPALSVPAAFGGPGPVPLPAGLQLIGQPQGDESLLDLAQCYEETIGDLLARPLAGP